MKERTLAIIKPDAVRKRVIGKIIQRIEDEGLEILEMKMVHLTKEEARQFYYIHKDKVFYDSLTDFMSSGRVVALLLEGEQAISHWREVMGSTDPAEAKPGTIRRLYGFSVERNAVHGSDSSETAEYEIKFFFG